LILIVISFVGGQYAILPVLGTACLLLPGNDDRFLSSKPLVFIGRMSYSLYLWHWPIFSLVDYQFYWQPFVVRLALKVTVSFAAAVASFYLIEQPGRIFLNRPGKMRIAFAALACSLVTLIPLGIAVRDANYLNAGARAIRSGGLHFNPKGRAGSMVLMGDSNGSMYGQVAKDVARARDLRLDVISVEAGDPLPNSAGQSPSLWLDSLAVVKREKPDFLLLVCKWEKLRDNRGRLAVALRELKPYAGSILLITQPPELPHNATREAIRNGARPPFWEEPEERLARLDWNGLVKSEQGDHVRVIDIEPLFSGEPGGIRFADKRWRQFYQDRDHLSVAGANLVKPQIIDAMTQAMTAGFTPSR
jgi:hypothetical protein